MHLIDSLTKQLLHEQKPFLIFQLFFSKRNVLYGDLHVSATKLSIHFTQLVVIFQFCKVFIKQKNVETNCKKRF